MSNESFTRTGAVTPREEAALALFADELGRHTDELISGSVSRYLAVLPDYTRLVADEGMDRLLDNMRRHFTTAADRARARSGGLHVEAGVAYSASAERARQGFPLTAILRSSQIASGVVWDWIIDDGRFQELRDDVIRFGWPIWLTYAEELARDAADAYVAVDRERARRDSTVRRVLVEQLVSGRLTHLETRRSLGEMGFDPSRPLTLAVVRWWGVDDDQTLTVVEEGRERIEQALSRRLAARPLTTTQDGDVLVLAQCRETERAELRQQLRLVAELPSNRDIEISGAVSDQISDLSGLRQMHAQLLHATAIGRRGRRIDFTSDISLLDHAVGAMHDILALVCPPDLKRFVAENAKSIDTWHPMLEALADHDLNVRATADHLHVHPNTIYYRLNQISTLSGRDTSTLRGLMDVLIVLRLRAQLEDSG